MGYMDTNVNTQAPNAAPEAVTPTTPQETTAAPQPSPPVYQQPAPTAQPYNAQGMPIQPPAFNQPQYTPQQQQYPPQQPIYYTQPMQQGGYNAPPPYNQYNQPMYPNAPAPQVSKRESFIGINLLSKIGVIFIIIGVIAFSAVSEDFLSPGIRTAIIFALGITMAGLGEVFYRKSSVIFARALTLGGIAELAISIIIGYTEYGSLNEWASLLIGVAVSAGAILLSLRYKSQTVMTVTAVSGILPSIVAFREPSALIASLVYLLLFQTAILILCNIRKWYVAPYTLLISNLILAIVLNSCLIDHYNDELAALVTTVFIVLISILYIVDSVVRSFKNNGALHASVTLNFITANAIMALISAILLMIAYEVSDFGFLMLFTSLAYFAVSAVAITTFEKCQLTSLLLNTAIIGLCIAILCLFPVDLIYIVFHFYAATLLVLGSFRNIKLLKVWGIITCCVSEYIFLNFCIFNIGEDIFTLQFAVNSVLWIIIMIVQALRKVRGAGMNAFSIAALSNIALFGSYTTLHISSALEDEGLLNGFNECTAFIMLFGSLIWMLIGFVTGKLKFMGKAAPITAIIFYFISLCGLGITNIVACISSPADNIICLIASLAVNAISMAAALDITLNIRTLAPKFSKAIGLVVSLYAMLCVTLTLGANEIVAFTNCIISIMYLALAIVWIIVGFIRRNAVLRRFGLALTLLACAKLFLLDFAGIGAVGRTLMFILFGVILLAVSFIYAIFESKLKKQEEAALFQQQQQQQFQYYNYYNSTNDPSNSNPQ